MNLLKFELFGMQKACQRKAQSRYLTSTATSSRELVQLLVGEQN